MAKRIKWVKYSPEKQAYWNEPHKAWVNELAKATKCNYITNESDVVWVPTKPASIRRYIDSNGSYRPFCDQQDIEATDSVNVDGGLGLQNIKCNTCGKTWNDIYKLIGYEYNQS